LVGGVGLWGWGLYMIKKRGEIFKKNKMKFKGGGGWGNKRDL